MTHLRVNHPDRTLSVRFACNRCGKETRWHATDGTLEHRAALLQRRRWIESVSVDGFRAHACPACAEREARR